MKSGRLHLLVLAFILAGVVWLLARHLYPGLMEPMGCLFHQVTGIPCPACGTTGSITALVQGNPAGALLLNPLGILMAAAMLVFPPWILSDKIRGTHTFVRFYSATEGFFRKKIIAVPAILLLIINWIWNILKFM